MMQYRKGILAAIASPCEEVVGGGEEKYVFGVKPKWYFD